MAHYFIGCDGGGTKTKTVCIDSSNAVKGSILTACTNKNSVGNEKTKEALQEGINGAISNAGIKKEEVKGICLGISGVDRQEDKDLIKGWVEEVLPGVEFAIHNDAVAALATGTGGDLFGVVIISGTGTIAYGYDRHGTSARSGGWGPLLGDEGSGYHIGGLILRAVVRAKDGTERQTSMTAELLRTLELSNEEGLIGWAYNGDQSWQRFASLAPIAYKCSNEGDQVATAILTQAADAMMSNIECVAARLGLDKLRKFPIVLAGGNLEHEGSPLTKILTSKLCQKYPEADITLPKVEPAVAAAMLISRQIQQRH